MNILSQMKLRETKLPDRMAVPYRIAIKTSGITRFGLTLYDEGYIDIFELDNHTKDANKTYIITNKFDPTAITSLVKE